MGRAEGIAVWVIVGIIVFVVSSLIGMHFFPRDEDPPTYDHEPTISVFSATPPVS